jgi:chromosome segregation ATPase
VEFECGKALNFVLGPNGSGKSSLVSAMCLGLGGSPSTLARADNVKSFIRHGEKKAVIEITLKAKEADAVIQIRRIITAGSDGGQGKSDWKLNGKTCTQAVIRGIVDELNIQVDNLCNFLPQERVHAFARVGLFSPFLPNFFYFLV